MNYYFGTRVANRQFKILTVLYKTRGATVTQILKALNLPINDNYKRNTWKALGILRKKGLITSYSLHNVGINGHLYFLNERSFEGMQLYLNIPPFHIGTGFNEDHGNFEYEIYKPPSKQLLHHLSYIDIAVASISLKQETVEHMYDFRDNRYATLKYKLKGSEKVRVYRPDAEIRILSNICSIEVDRSTERKDRLVEKFENYKSYFEYLTEQEKPLPKSIVFITDNTPNNQGIERRWQTITSAFFQVLSAYADQVNLVFETTTSFKDWVISELAKEETFQNIKTKISHYLELRDYKGTKLRAATQTHGFNYGEASFSISELDDRSILFLYIHQEGYETFPAIKIKRFFEFFAANKDKRNIFEKVRQIIPVLCYKHTTPYKLPFNQYEDLKKFQKLIDIAIYFRDDDIKGVWHKENPFKRCPLILH